MANKRNIINNPDFYRFFKRMTRKKIKNKERMGHRGPKQRYSVWRAEYNKKWEEIDSLVAERRASRADVGTENSDLTKP